VPAAERHGHGWAGARTKSHGPRTTRSRSASSTWQCRGQGTVWRSTAPRQSQRRQPEPLSKFLERIGAVKQRPVTPSTVLPPAPDVAHIPVVFSGTPRFSAEAVALYESCGRRFSVHTSAAGRRPPTHERLHVDARGDPEVYRAVIAQGAPRPVSARRCLQRRLLPMDFMTTATSRTTVPWRRRCWATSWNRGLAPSGSPHRAANHLRQPRG
jgi:hypothetical protein